MNSSNKQTDFEKALELLPWYAKNELSAEDSTWVKSQLSESSELQAELELIKKQVALTENYVDSLETQAFENQGSRLNALKNRIKIDTNTQKIEEEKLKPKGHNLRDEVMNGEGNSFWNKIASFLPKTQKQWQMAGAVALSIMVIQGVIIAQLAKPKGVEYETLSGGDPSLSGIVLLAKFKKDATMGQMQSFLFKSNLKIVGGPDLENQYRLALNKSVVRGKPLNDEEVSDLIFDLLDNQVVDFILREE